MSEEQIQEALGQINDPDINQVDNQDHDQPQEEELNLSPIEQKAWDQGWRPEEQFEGNPDNWKTAGEYVLFGEMQQQINDVKAEQRRKDAANEARITNLNKLHEAQQAQAIADLKAQQRAAVEVADTDEFDRLQRQIDNHSKAAKPVQAAPEKDPAIEAWEARNPWINDAESEKAQQAQAFWAVAGQKPGATASSALAYVDAQMAKLYPEDSAPSNPRRDMATMTEQSRTQGRGRRGSRELTMSDLTRDEQNQWQQFGQSMFSSEKDFLKAVADSRKA